MIDQILPFLSNNRLIQVIFTTIIAFLVSKNSIPVIITISRLKNLMDIPDGRSSHTRKTPTLGGVAIFASILISYFIAQGLWPATDGGQIINLTIVAIVILFFLGVKDDILVLSPAKKMILQIASSALTILGSNLMIDNFFGIFGFYNLPVWVSILLTIFIFIALINSMNLIDGIDGLAGSISLHAAVIFGLWFFANNYYSLSFLAAAVCGALIGFLRYNLSKTNKIFMGDTGSLILGFILTVFAIKFINLNKEFINGEPMATVGSAPILAIILLIVPIFDTLRVFIIRILNGKSPFLGDRNHLHHIMVDLGLSHHLTTAILVLCTNFLTIFFIYVRKILTNNQSLFMLIGLFALYLLICNYLKQKIKTETPEISNI